MGGVVICDARMGTFLGLVNMLNTGAEEGGFNYMQLIFQINIYLYSYLEL